MKYLLTIIAGILILGTSTAQSLKTENCKWQKCVLIPYTEDMSQDLAVVSLQSIHTGRKVSKLSELNDKEVKKIKKAMRAFKSCTAYVDIGHKMVNKELNPRLSDGDLSYMIVLEKDKN